MSHLQAAIFDMDGVVIDSAKLHYTAWKAVLDKFLHCYYLSHNVKFHAFTEQDYLYYVDGISRYDGVKRFLDSRQIILPDGTKQSRALNTIYGIGNRKNALFHRLIEQDNVKSFSSSIRFIKLLRKQGIKTALISASKNCNSILKSAHVTDLFDVTLSGHVIERKHIAGKPAPDIFLEASKRLNLPPQDCMVIEDALLGVQAGHAGKFGLVVGVDRNNLGSALFREHGADIVVTDLSELKVKGVKHWFEYKLNYIFDNQAKLNPDFDLELKGKKLALFFDYDGTLTPIVSHPDLAIIHPAMLSCLKKLSQHNVVAIISGRELKDLKSKIHLDNVYYAGNHGLEISGPKLTYSTGSNFIAEMQLAYKTLVKRLGMIKGIFIENKRYSLSVHFRLVAEYELSKIQQIIDLVLQHHPSLVKHGGKKVIEIRPNMVWDKGKAVQWLLSNLQLSRPTILPIYIGDDITDEDAFLALKASGIGIIVTNSRQPTKAKYCLRDPEEVKKFLQVLITRGTA